MIPAEILSELVPSRFPEDDFRPSLSPYEYSREGSERWIGIWSQYLRYRLQRDAEGGYFAEALDRTGFVATGIFRVAGRSDDGASSEFPIVAGFQFGALLLRGAQLDDFKQPTIVLESGR